MWTCTYVYNFLLLTISHDNTFIFFCVPPKFMKYCKCVSERGENKKQLNFSWVIERPYTKKLS